MVQVVFCILTILNVHIRIFLPRQHSGVYKVLIAAGQMIYLEPHHDVKLLA